MIATRIREGVGSGVEGLGFVVFVNGRGSVVSWLPSSLACTPLSTDGQTMLNDLNRLI